MILEGSTGMLPLIFKIRCSEITSEAVSVKMLLESPTCSYLQPVSHTGLSTFQRGKVMQVALKA